MASKSAAKEKFVRSVSDPIALTKMTTKLSAYLGVSVSESSPPVRAWKEIMAKAAGELFEKCYDNMQAAYKG